MFADLLFAGWEHGDDGKADGLHRQGRGPVLCQYAEADVAIGVDVWVDGDVFTHKDHLEERDTLYYVFEKLDGLIGV